MLDVPPALRIAYEIQARPRKGKSAEFKTPGKQRRPAKPRPQSVRAKKIFIAEARIFRNGDGIRLEPRAVEQAEIESANIHGTPKARFEMSDQESARGAGPQRTGKSDACGKQRDGKNENPRQRFSFTHCEAKN